METPVCLRCRHLLSAAMDGEATFNETEFIHHHLMGCPDCREAQQAYHSLRAQLRLLSTPEPPAALRMAVMSRVNGRKAVYAGRKPAAGLYLAPWQKAVFATAAFVLVFVAGFVASMLLRPQPFEVEGPPVANTTEQKVVIAFNRPVDRNYIIENASTLFSVKDSQNNPLEIDYANIVVDGNTVELPIKRDGNQLQENEKIQVVVDSHIKDEKGAEIANPGPKAAVAVTQAPAVAPKTKPGQVQAAITTAVPPTVAATATTAPATTAPAPQAVDDPTSTPVPPTATISPTAVITPTATIAPATPTVTVPVTVTATVSPTLTLTPTVSVTPTVPVTTTVPATVTVPPTVTTPRPTSTSTIPATTVPVTVTGTTGTPGTPTVPVTGTPVISATTTIGPSTTPGTPSTVSGSPSPSVSPSVAACSSTELTGGFKQLYPNAAARLGCATTPQSQASFTYQVFQKGSMLYYQQTGRIYVFYSFGGWSSYRATGPVAQAVTNTPTGTVSSVTPKPSGCSVTPRGSFGTLWNNNQAVQSSLGCPTGQDNSTSAALVQNFSRGLMLYNPLANLPYSVVYADGGFQAFPEQ